MLLKHSGNMGFSRASISLSKGFSDVTLGEGMDMTLCRKNEDHCAEFQAFRCTAAGISRTLQAQAIAIGKDINSPSPINSY